MPNFTDLPAELRIAVYDFYFGDVAEHVSVGGIKYLTILYTSRLIAGEAAKVRKQAHLSLVETDRSLDRASCHHGSDQGERAGAA